MNNTIKKINFYHSIIFFLLSISLTIIIYQFESLIISPIICLLLILSIGISHGALDNQKGKKLIQLYNIRKFYYFYLIYSMIVLSVIIFWLYFPATSLIIFLIVASYHFGKEDMNFLIKNKNTSNLIFFFFKGALIIIAPLFFHFTETVDIFKLLLIQNENFFLFLDFIETNHILSFALLMSLLVNTYYFLNNLKAINVLIFLDFFSIIVLNYFLSPLIAFTIYFCFLHSFRHSISLISELDINDFKNGAHIFVKKAIPLTLLTAVIYVISLYILSNYYQLNEAILKVIFIGLASLTFPHILLEYLLEKNEK
ncbi:Brp/Blh family beta-carotene 15,15'-dioxygenase [Candidatus Pelagibacter sp. Uisw_090]|uniref:Brp/Blh family beta-carotene 15,15'-dioxygenase n=1 Tax=Candidatus Pelagibacter sp. Uisw_090 TaxID=3230993 RepID=UPI0039EB1011